MDTTAEKTVYKAFGLTFDSYLSLPEIPQIEEQKSSVDVSIKKADLVSEWSNLVLSNKYLYVKENFIMFKLSEVAIFLVQNGNEILVSPLGEVKEEELRLYILGTCMGAVLMQRQILPLHGSAVVIDGKAYAVVGESGAGKSTLASMLLRRGCQLLSDDVIPVRLSDQFVPYVTSSYPQQKLWQESLEHFGMEPSQFRPLTNRDTKFAVPILDQFIQESMPLAGVVELVKTKDEKVKIHPVPALQRLQTLFTHTYRNFFINPAGLTSWHFETIAKIANHVSFYQIRRPVSSFTAWELAETVLTTINKEEKIHD